MQAQHDWKLPNPGASFVQPAPIATPSHTAADDAPASRRRPGGGLLSLPLPTAADARFARLSEPGIVAILRHAFAPGTGDPANFALDDCTTQRNLDARGREQARKIWAAIHTAGATVDRVITSQWCRCRDTARFLDLGPVEDLPALNSFFRNRDRTGPQTAELRQFLLGLQPGDTLILVTHQVNITALTGRIPASGEVFLLRVGRDGTISVVDEILIGPWR